jgi:outer membrane protein TolC
MLPSLLPALPFLLILGSPQADTVRLSPAEALERVRATSPTLEAARQRSLGAEARAGQARAFANPILTTQVENVGAARDVTGLPAPEGLEGQSFLSFPIPVGGDRSARIREADALADAAGADADAVRGDVVLGAVVAVAVAERDGVVADQAGAEARTLELLADALTLQAEEGRASEGDAARARLAAALADGRAADARAAAAAAEAELARVLGLPPDRAVRVEGGACAATATLPEPGSPPELRSGRAREDAARAALDRAEAARIPDLRPEAGWRRGAGVDGLYLGLGVELPLFDRGGRARDAAAAELRAASAELRAVEREVESRRLAAARALAALEEAGTRFRAGWVADLSRVVEATEARYELGEGTLTELLDGRRARFEALVSRERWRAAWRIQRARLLRLDGAEATPALFCDPLERDR